MEKDREVKKEKKIKKKKRKKIEKKGRKENKGKRFHLLFSSFQPRGRPDPVSKKNRNW